MLLQNGIKFILYGVLIAGIFHDFHETGPFFTVFLHKIEQQ